MDRRAFIGTLAGGLLAGPLTAAAQQTGKVYRVGHLAASTPSAENTRLLAAFHGELEKQPMRTLAKRRSRAQGKAQLRRDGGAGDVWA